VSPTHPPQPWHGDAIATALRSDAPAWRVTAIFAMRWVEGFEQEVLEALDADDPAIRYQAVCAAASWELDGAWPHIERVLSDPAADKALLIAAIEAASSIRPADAPTLLADLTHSDDEDIREAVSEAMLMAEVPSYGELDELEDDEEDDGRLFR